MTIDVRDEQPADRVAVREVNEMAFGQPTEANVVEVLHQWQAAVLSLVAIVDARIAGHILFSPVTVEHDAGKRLAGLAPVAVRPKLQKQGIGSLLVRAGLVRCHAAGCDGVVVVGHADYYPRFGFARADAFGLCCEYDVPPEVFMALALPGRSLDGVSGVVRFHPAFAQAGA